MFWHNRNTADPANQKKILDNSNTAMKDIDYEKNFDRCMKTYKKVFDYRYIDSDDYFALWIRP